MNEIIGKIALVLIGAVIVCLVTALPVFFLWNWLMPVIFGLVKITFWQALGMCFLLSVLFKSTVFKQ